MAAGGHMPGDVENSADDATRWRRLHGLWRSFQNSICRERRPVRIPSVGDKDVLNTIDIPVLVYRDPAASHCYPIPTHPHVCVGR